MSRWPNLIALGLTVITAACGDRQPDAASPAACTPARPALAGAGARSLVHDGVERSYLLAVPADDDGRTARPLVLNLHGHGGSMTQQETNTRLGELGAARGVVVVTPEALGSPRRWNFDRAPGQADDYGFLHALLADVTATLCIDPERVALAGHSNGSAFAALLACDPPYEARALAMVSATVPPSCPDGVAPSVLAIHGTADATVPYDGGALGGARLVVDRWAERSGCVAPPREEEIFPGVVQRSFDGCAGGAAVTLDSVQGGVHAWPGSAAAIARRENSEAGRTFPASERILDFFTERLP